MTKFGKGRLSNTRVLEIYELLHTKAFTLDEEYREFLEGTTDKEKTYLIKRILSILFHTKIIERKGIEIIE